MNKGRPNNKDLKNAEKFAYKLEQNMENISEGRKSI